MESEQKLSVKMKQLKQAKQLQTLTNQKLEKEVSEEVPRLQLKVKSLTTETGFLQMQLKRRNEEMEMFEKMKQSAKQDELQLLESLLKEKNEQIRSLQDDLTQKKMEVDATKKQLRDKETELAGMMEEWSAQVVELETEVERLRQSFNEQQEEMNKKSIETSAASVSPQRSSGMWLHHQHKACELFSITCILDSARYCCEGGKQKERRDKILQSRTDRQGGTDQSTF